MDTDNILRQILDCEEDFFFQFDAMKLFVLISHLQVAQRYWNGGSAAIARQLIDSFTNALCREVPDARELIELGNHPELDVSAEYFDEEF